jgi:signal transduction histidine kinase
MSRSAAQAVAASRSAVAVSSILEEKRGLKPLDGFLHSDLWDDDELLGRARLQILFGVLGGLCGVAFSGFFFAIGHVYGGTIIGSCGLATTLVPWAIRHSGNLKATGYLYGFVLLMGFTGLCAVGGGVKGYAVPWLAAVPLAMLLLVDLRSALTWTAVAFTTVLAFAICEMVGYGFPTLYKDSWEPAVASVSAVGLVAMLVFLGLSFEKTRAEAFRRMQFSRQQLELANGDLRGRNDEKNSVLNIAAHGLKLPLSRICEHADRLRHAVSPSDVEIGQRADEILKAADRSLQRVDRLLDLPSLEAGRGALKKEPVDVEAVSVEVIRTLGEKAADAGTSVRLADGDDDVPLVVNGDSEALFQILENLVANAVEHSPVGGVVEIRTGRDRSLAVIEICDEGPGLAEDHGAKLFRKVSHSSEGRAVSENDSALDSELGLGLWIVRRLTEAMGGTVFCRSETGSGSAFGVRLPLVSADVLDQLSNSPKVSEAVRQGDLGVKPVEFPATFQASVNAAAAVAFVPGDPLVGRLNSDSGVTGDSGNGGDISEGDNVALPS